MCFSRRIYIVSVLRIFFTRSCMAFCAELELGMRENVIIIGRVSGLEWCWVLGGVPTYGGQGDSLWVNETIFGKLWCSVCVCVSVGLKLMLITCGRAKSLR